MARTPAKAEANARYDAKTYKRYGLYLRADDDKDIIKDVERAKRNGYTLRDWIKELFEGQN